VLIVEIYVWGNKNRMMELVFVLIIERCVSGNIWWVDGKYVCFNYREIRVC
jgi:hypothetical protein